MTHWQRLQKDGYITLKVFEPKQRAQLRKELQCIVAASNKYKRMVDKGLVMRSFRASFHKPWIRKIRKILNPILLHQCNIPHWTVPDTCIRAWVNFEPLPQYYTMTSASPVKIHVPPGHVILFYKHMVQKYHLQWRTTLLRKALADSIFTPILCKRKRENPCGECGVDMGMQEYSQLCGGHYCMNTYK